MSRKRINYRRTNTGKTRDFFFNDLQYIGQVFAAYIIAKDQNGLYLIDQHAAHERVFYEKLCDNFNSMKKSSQPILTPIIISVSADVYNADRTKTPVDAQ